jgi:polyphosphate glucokinase
VERFDGRDRIQIHRPQARELAAVDARSPLNNVRGAARRDRVDKKSLGKNVLVVDIGGTSVKILASGHKIHRSFPSGPKLTPKEMVSSVKRLAADWTYDAVSIGYPGPVLCGRPIAEPYNLGRGWVGFNFAEAFSCSVMVINDAAMQAVGSYNGGKMLFLGLGTGLGSTMIVDGIVEPMELGHLPYKKSTYEDYVGKAGLDRRGKKKWRRDVADVVGRLITALEPEDTVLGGGNVHKLKTLPPHTRAGDNDNAFRGGFRLWEKTKILGTEKFVPKSGPE